MKFRLPTTLAAIGLTFPLASCGLLYDVGQQDASRSCEREVTHTEREACRQKYAKTYEQYEADRQATRGAGTGPKDGPKEKSLCFRRASTGELVCPN